MLAVMEFDRETKLDRIFNTSLNDYHCEELDIHEV